MTAKRLLLHATMVFGLLLAAYLLYRVFRGYSLNDITKSITAIPLPRLAASAGFAAASYICLTGFDWLGLRYAGKPLSYPKAALASFTALAIGHNLGVAALSSGAVRYRFYARWGLSAEEVARNILFCGVTVGLGLIALASVALLLNPQDAAAVVHLNGNELFWLGIACGAVPVAYMGLSMILKAPLRIWKWHFKMPGPRLALAQIIVGTLNFICVAACLHQLVAAGSDVSFVKTATAFVLANIAILVTHVPGGLGVLEATVQHVMPNSASIGALIAFRTIYFLIPLVMGIALLIVSEIIFRRGKESKKDASEPRLDERGVQAHLS
ncbi:lysylphosphatidylglycerol synthase domain-containing protein [Oryzifoliimicrobium ureilyticus]|uniref:lysylphosphatidylglycerol synthase domain-containing protein n=1 Tax=Oryzifoliimicrobium ureilyticus TaxID=3113724 RepID=UPI0030765179